MDAKTYEQLKTFFSIILILATFGLSISIAAYQVYAQVRFLEVIAFCLIGDYYLDNYAEIKHG